LKIVKSVVVIVNVIWYRVPCTSRWMYKSERCDSLW